MQMGSRGNPRFHSGRRQRHQSTGDIDLTKPKIKISQDLENDQSQSLSEQKCAKNGHLQNGSRFNGNRKGRQDKKVTKRQLFTPQEAQGKNSTPVQNGALRDEVDENSFYNFVAPSWADFKFDYHAILDCLT